MNSDNLSITSKMMLKSPLYREIIESGVFKRLNSVSFLGAIDYVLKPRKGQRKATRASHSIGVAELALLISDERNYTTEIENHLVVAALLHDIGHAPLSHSMESCFKDIHGLDHHTATINIIKGHVRKGKHLNKLLQKYVDVDLIIDLISQESKEEFSDLFNSPMNIDTIDGIYNASKYLYINHPFIKEEVALAVFSSLGDRDGEILDKFWKSKHDVYDKVINTGIGALADLESRKYFYESKDRLFESDFYISEETFFKKHSNLKIELKKLKNILLTDSGEYDYNFELTKRIYDINQSVKLEKKEDVFNRYSCVKEKVVLKISSIDKNGDFKFEQLRLV